MAMVDAEVKFDSTNSHILSQKAIDEGWDVFIFSRELVRPGPLLVGLAVNKYQLKAADVCRWLNIMTRGESLVTPPPAIHPCEIERLSPTFYVARRLGPLVDWNACGTLAPGNYGLVERREGDCYISPMMTITHGLMFVPKTMRMPRRGLKISFTVASTKKTSMCQIYINPLSSNPVNSNNVISLPTLLKDDFYENKFTYDYDVQKFITFGASQQTEDFLSNCTMETKFDADPSYLMEHLRISLQLHCYGGDLSDEYPRGVVLDRLDEFGRTKKRRWPRRDRLDVAITTWQEELENYFADSSDDEEEEEA
ncbi:hypothetical protein PM082_019448 [Marasmius tenuissimus]|nr:hypothetical protein PM082_019448 [Marasmius tenuissimus]